MLGIGARATRAKMRLTPSQLSTAGPCRGAWHVGEPGWGPLPVCVPWELSLFRWWSERVCGLPPCRANRAGAGRAAGPKATAVVS